MIKHSARTSREGATTTHYRVKQEHPMSLALIELHTNYLKLRHDLAAAGYQLVRPVNYSCQIRTFTV